MRLHAGALIGCQRLIGSDRAPGATGLRLGWNVPRARRGVDPRYFDLLKREQMKAALAVALSNCLPDLPGTMRDISPAGRLGGSDRGVGAAGSQQTVLLFHCQQARWQNNS